MRRLDGRGGSWQLSTQGGGGVRWGREGREIFFVTGETLVRVPIEIRGDALTVGPTQALFEVPTSPTAITFPDYDYDPRATDSSSHGRLGPSRSRARSRFFGLGGEAEGAGEVRTRSSPPDL